MSNLFLYRTIDWLVLQRATECTDANLLVAQLSKGILTDAKGRIGGIVANYQFQFDGPPSQAGTIYNGGWSVCNNGSLAIGNDAVFYQCLSGDFYNLYLESTGAQCEEVLIDIIPCAATATTTAAAVTQTTDGQVQASSAVTQITDGQVQASSAASAVTQISDGQIQASSAAVVPVSQYTDGQLQATVAATATVAVSQISDGQIQATSAASTAVAVSQISDGQIQATTSAAKTSTAAAVTQISDGQVQASSATTFARSTGASATTTAAVFTGAANAKNYGSFGAAAVGVAAMALL